MSAATLDLDKLHLAVGAHSPDGKFCVMEAVAYVAGEPWSDHPDCASPVIAAFLRRWNDDLKDEPRQMLKPLIPRLVGTNTGAEDEEARAWLATDWLARECAPAFLRLVGLTQQAEALEALAPVLSPRAAKTAQPTLDSAKKEAAAAWDATGAAAGAAARAAAWDAAWDAAGAAARDAAGAAARDAAGAAARAAAWDAARDAAGAAARDAAGAAARDALQPTVAMLQASALQLIERMIEVVK